VCEREIQIIIHTFCKKEEMWNFHSYSKIDSKVINYSVNGMADLLEKSLENEKGKRSFRFDISE
jgi:hypothetical protein